MQEKQAGGVTSGVSLPGLAAHPSRLQFTGRVISDQGPGPLLDNWIGDHEGRAGRWGQTARLFDVRPRGLVCSAHEDLAEGVCSHRPPTERASISGSQGTEPPLDLNDKGA